MQTGSTGMKLTKSLGKGVGLDGIQDISTRVTLACTIS
jgi:hypothetical protein